MPYVICNAVYEYDPVGKHIEADLKKTEISEVVRLRPGDDLIVAGTCTELSESDLDMVIVCTCGLMFWEQKHPHFTMAGPEHTLSNLEDQLGKLEKGTAAHKALAAEVKAAKKNIADERKEHAPAGTLADSLAATKAASEKTTA